MLNALDGTEVTLRCPYCDHQMKQPAGRLKSHPMLTCLECGKQFRFEGNVWMKLAQDAVERARQGVGRLMGRASR